MLYWVDDKGNLKQCGPIVAKQLDAEIAALGEDNYNKLFDLFARTVDGLDKTENRQFFVGKLWPGTWKEPELVAIWETFQDSELCAKFLGVAMFNYLAEVDEEDWYCTKTQFLQREFKHMHYWERRL